MGITILKKKVIEKSVSAEDFKVVGGESLAVAVDMFASSKSLLEEKTKQLKKKMADELKDLTKVVASREKALLALFDESHLGSESDTLEGEYNYDVKIGAKASKVTNIDTPKLIKALGQETYMEIAKVGVGDIRSYCNPKQVATILTEENTGKRSIKIIQR